MYETSTTRLSTNSNRELISGSEVDRQETEWSPYDDFLLCSDCVYKGRIHSTHNEIFRLRDNSSDDNYCNQCRVRRDKQETRLHTDGYVAEGNAEARAKKKFKLEKKEKRKTYRYRVKYSNIRTSTFYDYKTIQAWKGAGANKRMYPKTSYRHSVRFRFRSSDLANARCSGEVPGHGRSIFKKMTAEHKAGGENGRTLMAFFRTWLVSFHLSHLVSKIIRNEFPYTDQLRYCTRFNTRKYEREPASRTSTADQQYSRHCSKTPFNIKANSPVVESENDLIVVHL